jgi:hypothetical protein
MKCKRVTGHLMKEVRPSDEPIIQGCWRFRRSMAGLFARGYSKGCFPITAIVQKPAIKLLIIIDGISQYDQPSLLIMLAM